MVESELSPEEEAAMIDALRHEWTHEVPPEYFAFARDPELDLAPGFSEPVDEEIHNQGFSGWLVSEFIVPEQPPNKTSGPEQTNNQLVEMLRDTQRLSPIGQVVQQHLRGQTVVDVGSGVGRTAIADVADAFQAKRYIGIDIEETDHAIRRNTILDFRIHGDMLETLASIPDNYGSIVISGIENLEVANQYTYLDQQGHEQVHFKMTKPPYLDKLLEEIFRIVSPEGLLIVGPNTDIPDPKQTGFELFPGLDYDQSKSNCAIVYRKKRTNRES